MIASAGRRGARVRGYQLVEVGAGARGQNMVDIVFPFRKMSTKPDQAQTGRRPPSGLAEGDVSTFPDSATDGILPTHAARTSR